MSEQPKVKRVQVNVLVPQEAAGTVRKLAAALRDNPGLAERVLGVLGLDEPPSDRLAGLSGRVDALEGGLSAVLARLDRLEGQPGGSAADAALVERLDELAARLEQYIAATDACLARLEERRPEPATSAGTAAVAKPASGKKRTSNRQPAAPSDVPADELLARLRAAVDADGRPKYQIAKEIGFDPGDLSSVLNGKKPIGEARRAKIEAWLAAREAAVPAEGGAQP